MPRGRVRNPAQDGRARQLLSVAINSPGRWTAFRFTGSYEDRLTLQRAIFYLNNHESDGSSVRVQWQDSDGSWGQLRTPRAVSDGRIGIWGGPIGRLRVHTKSEARAVIRTKVANGTASYDTLTHT